jgi:hypothetical protein
MFAAREKMLAWSRSEFISDAVACRLRTADAPPFIGQVPLLENERSVALEILEQSDDPFATLCMLLDRRGPLALALIAGEVAAQDDPTLHEVSVYPLIDRLLGKGAAPLTRAFGWA